MEDTTNIKRVARLSIIFSILVLLLKFSAYWYTGSVSVLSDALESFVNVASALFSYYIIILAKTPADEGHPYGHQKAEFFASGLEGILIVLAAVTIFAYAIEKLLHGYSLSSVNMGVLISIVASLLNAVIARILLTAAKKYNSITLEANAKHILTDIWTTVFVAIGLIVIGYFPQYAWIDPILAIVLSAFILNTGIGLLKRSIDGLMDASLPQEEVEEILNIIHHTVDSSHEIRSFRSKSQGSTRFIDFKLMVPADMSVKDSHAVCDKIEENIDKAFMHAITIIHVEPL